MIKIFEIELDQAFEILKNFNGSIDKLQMHRNAINQKQFYSNTITN